VTHSREIAATALLAAALATTVLAAPAVALEACGDVKSAKPRAVEVEAGKTSCKEALTVAETWLKRTRSGACDEFDCELKGFECHAKRPDEPSYRVKCLTDGGRVQWTVTRKRPAA
jgi:hypothetical protein